MKPSESISSVKNFVLIVLLFLPISCAINPVTGERELMLISESQELEIGRKAAPSLEWEFGGRYHDRELESYLEDIVKRIWQNSERPHLPVRFYIQNTSIPNAFALPGYVAITRGLLSGLENEAQFVAVIGHEIGHVMARHTAQRLSRVTLQRLGMAIGAEALAGKDGGETLLTLGAIGSSLLLLKYDRDQEIQADRLGVRYMARLGYDPTEALKAHEKVKTLVNDYLKRTGKSPANGGFIAELFSTHPRTEVRLSEIQVMINELPPYPLRGDGRFRERYQTAIKDIRRINEVYFIYDEAEGYYRKNRLQMAEERLKKAIKLNDSQPPFYNLLGFIRLRQKNLSGAEELFRKALSVDAGYQPSIYGLGLVSYFRGNYNLAISKFRRSLELYPDHIPTHFGMGKSYFSMRRYADAIPYLKEVAEAVPRDPEVHGMLGICYEKVGYLRSAVREYRYQVRVAPNTKLGRHAKRRLAVLEPLLRLQ
jgi:predicted Zn-dependent protease